MSRVNLVLLTVECWREDHLGPVTPNLARLGAESAVFRNAYATGGWTYPSMTAMMSSAYASMFGGLQVGLATPARQVLAERLQESGYWTAGFSANPICGSLRGFHRGFGTFRDERQEPLRTDSPPGKVNWRRMVEMGISPRETDTLCTAAQLTGDGIGWLEGRNTEEPFFLWLHYMDPHWPCLTPVPPPESGQLDIDWQDRYLFRTEVIPRRGKYDPGEEARLRWADRYRRALAEADREIGRLLQHLSARPDWDHTVVLATGDHGEELLDHGIWHHSWNQMYNEGIRVPMILRVPGAPASLHTQPISHLDIAPTLLEYGKAPQHAGRAPMQGRSLRPLIEGDRLENRAVYSEMLGHDNGARYKLAIVDGDWKYRYDLEDPHGSTLFRLSTDPEERENLRDRFPEIFRRFEALRLAHVSKGMLKLLERRTLSAELAKGDDIVREQMIALGYLADDEETEPQIVQR